MIIFFPSIFMEIWSPVSCDLLIIRIDHLNLLNSRLTVFLSSSSHYQLFYVVLSCSLHERSKLVVPLLTVTCGHIFCLVCNVLLKLNVPVK